MAELVRYGVRFRNTWPGRRVLNTGFTHPLHRTTRERKQHFTSFCFCSFFCFILLMAIEPRPLQHFLDGNVVAISSCRCWTGSVTQHDPFNYACDFSLRHIIWHAGESGFPEDLSESVYCVAKKCVLVAHDDMVAPPFGMGWMSLETLLNIDWPFTEESAVAERKVFEDWLRDIASLRPSCDYRIIYWLWRG